MRWQKNVAPVLVFYSISIIARTNYHKVSSLKQYTFMISKFYKSEVSIYSTGFSDFPRLFLNVVGLISLLAVSSASRGRPQSLPYACLPPSSKSATVGTAFTLLPLLPHHSIYPFVLHPPSGYSLPFLLLRISGIRWGPPKWSRMISLF